MFPLRAVDCVRHVRDCSEDPEVDTSRFAWGGELGAGICSEIKGQAGSSPSDMNEAFLSKLS